MEVITTMDQGIIKAIKNSNVIKWILKFTQTLRPEDVKKEVERFTKEYMSIDSESGGAAGVDGSGSKDDQTSRPRPSGRPVAFRRAKASSSASIFPIATRRRSV